MELKRRTVERGMSAMGETEGKRAASFSDFFSLIDFLLFSSSSSSLVSLVCFAGSLVLIIIITSFIR